MPLSHCSPSGASGKASWPDSNTDMSKKIEIRKRGSSELPPEDIAETTPPIRDSKSAIPKPVGEKQIYQLVHEIYVAGLLKPKRPKGPLHKEVLQDEDEEPPS